MNLIMLAQSSSVCPRTQSAIEKECEIETNRVPRNKKRRNTTQHNQKKETPEGI